MRHRSGDESGYTLVELTVVMSIMAVVSSLTAGLVITGMKSTKQSQARTAASQDVQREVERLARDLRVADPLRVTEANRVVLDLYRGNTCVRRTYELAANTLIVSSTTYPTWSACATYPATATPTAVQSATFLSPTANGASPLLTYRGTAGALPASPAPATVTSITVTLSKSAPGWQGVASLSTTVGVRNAKIG